MHSGQETELDIVSPRSNSCRREFIDRMREGLFASPLLENRMRTSLAALLLLALAGCQTDQNGMTSQSMTEQAQDRECQSFGVLPGSTGYLQCRETLATDAADRERRQAAAAN